MKQQQSGSKGDGQTGPKSKSGSPKAGAGHVKGGATKKSGGPTGPVKQQSGSKGG